VRVSVALAACAFLYDPRGRVLLVRCRDRPDTWEPPGGAVEDGEDPGAAAAREVLEETGLHAALLGCSGAYWNTRAPRLCLAFVGRADGPPRPSAETPGVAWFSPTEADQAIARPALHLRWEDAQAARTGRPAGYAVYRSTPLVLLRRLASAGGR
jgi:8-oxo-dGTP pyrophosphatase MutT (NUDIX family)